MSHRTDRSATPTARAGDSGRPFRVLVVCTGNICRSPMAEQVLRRAFAQAGMDGAVTVSSAGTGRWHVGQGADPAARRVLAAAGYPDGHVARQVTAGMVNGADLVLAADGGHRDALRAMAADPARVHLLREYDPDADGPDVPDPYGQPDGAFEEVLAMLEDAAPGVVDAVGRRIA